MHIRKRGERQREDSLRRRNGFLAQCGRVARAAGVASAVALVATVSFPFVPTALANIVLLDLEPAHVTPLPPLSTLVPNYVDEHEVRLLAATAWGEARSEGEDGMRAVAHVIVNRVGARFGMTVEDVVRAPWQFSVWNRGDPNRPLVMNPDRYAVSGANYETWQIAQRIAREVLSGQSTDPTNGALFYHTTEIRPWWSRYGQGARTIGAHIFYRDVPDQRRTRAEVTQVAQHFDQGLPIDDALQQPTAGDVVITPEAARAAQQLRAQLAAAETAGDTPVAINTPVQASPISASN